tara:strand:+ start:125 stop:526 length:402 start_codon:yes stop_codon:yes gene_type:complete
MAKASSPVRLESNLMKAASVAGIVMHRSAAEQIEYWADLGRKVAKNIDPESLLAVQAGLAELRIEHTESSPLDPDAVFAALDNARSSGTLTQAVSSDSLRYQASVTKPGYLEACYPDGRVETGRFADGRFVSE